MRKNVSPKQLKAIRRTYYKNSKKKNKSGKNDMPVWLSIIFVGFVAGLLFAVGLETGISPDEGGISVLVVETMCTAMPDGTSFNCGSFIFLMVVLSIILGIAAIFEEANRMNNWIVGLVLYGIGWIVGLIYILTH